ncbi:MAG: tryptophan 2,3-dioxygenase [Planctomycetota bacterium]
MSGEYDKLKFEKLNYNSYLKVPELLSLQHQISDGPHHDEMFFIIIHQASELWFKNLLHETELLIKAFREGYVSHALKVLKRMSAIMELLARQITLLGTLTPVEFAGFRDKLNPASGFQSAQFRIMEFTFGLRDPFYIKFFESMPEVAQRLESIRRSPCVYDEFLACLSKAGFKVPSDILKSGASPVTGEDATRDTSRKPHEGLVALFKGIYEKPQDNFHWVLLFEALIDFDSHMAGWRHHHIQSVSRTIGTKSGTGGSSGVAFLQGRASLRFFPELWEVRTHIGSTNYGG